MVSVEHGKFRDEIDRHLSPEAVLDRRIYVFELPVRLYHWILFFTMIVLVTTGLWMQWASPSTFGPTYQKFWYGTLREIHVATGYILTAATVVRIYWAFVGNVWSRQIFTLPIFRLSFWAAMFAVIKEYSFLDRSPPRKWIGHNPLSQVSMLGYMVILLFTLLTGLMLVGINHGADHWASVLFGWLVPAFGTAADVIAWHALAMWLNIAFITVHIYMVVREDVMSRQSITETMIHGWRMYKDDKPSRTTEV
jgi:Ni/Fe-hydrogenase 1 B-type cytochrome subunit